MALIEILNEGRRLYYEERLSIRDVVIKLMPLDLSPDELDVVISHGLRWMLRRSVSGERQGESPGVDGQSLRSALSYGPSRSETAREYYKLTSTLYETVSGVKPLIEFTAQDCADRVEAEDMVMAGAERRRSWFLSATVLLKSSKAKTVGDLPPATRAALEQKARELFERAARVSEKAP